MAIVSYMSASPCTLVLEAQELLFCCLDPGAFLGDPHINKATVSGFTLPRHTLVLL